MFYFSALVTKIANGGFLVFTPQIKILFYSHLGNDGLKKYMFKEKENATILK